MVEISHPNNCNIAPGFLYYIFVKFAKIRFYFLTS